MSNDPNTKQSDAKAVVAEKFDFLDGLPAVELLELFPSIDEVVEPYSALEGGSTVLDIALLRSLARRYSNCRFLEVGTWRGETVANLAQIAETCVSISLSDQSLQDLNLQNEIPIHRFFSHSLSNVTNFQADSQAFDFSQLHKNFDLIFVDADHSQEAVRIDTGNALPALFSQAQGTIVWHDYGFTEETINWEVFAGILEGLPSAAHKHLMHVTNTCCAIYAPWCTLSRGPMEYPKVPRSVFKVRVSGRNL